MRKICKNAAQSLQRREENRRQKPASYNFHHHHHNHDHYNFHHYCKSNPTQVGLEERIGAVTEQLQMLEVSSNDIIIIIIVIVIVIRFKIIIKYLEYLYR